MLTPNLPRKGDLILSEPFMIDPNFKRSVVFLTESEEAGAVGFVLNQKSNLILSDVLPDVPSDLPIFVGGPVEHDSLHFIHKAYDKLNSGVEIARGVFWGGNFEALKVLLEQGQLSPAEIKFFVGYSGWAPGQLDAEITENAWLATSAYDTELLFVEDEENLWREVVISLGPKYAHIANFPENPQWN